MKTSHLIALTATIVACTGTTASARPVVDPPASEPTPVTSGSMSAHRQQMSDEQWQRSQAQPAPAPLTDRTATDDGFPLGLVLIGATGLLIVAIGRPVLFYGRHRRHPTSAA